MEWYHYTSIVILIFMVASPAWFFNKIEKLMFDGPDEPHLHIQHINPTHIIPNGESMEDIVRDEKVLANLNKMIRVSKKKHVKNLWKLKKVEFERQMRWKRTQVNYV